jgi:serine protease Do
MVTQFFQDRIKMKRRLIAVFLFVGLVSSNSFVTSVVWAAPVPESFADLAEKLLPAVVNISTTQTIKNAERLPEMPQLPPGSPFEDFFKDFLDRQHNGNQGGRPRKATALGSGFIIDSSGIVVTNNHVIAEADEITVVMQDGQAFKAEIMGKDERADLALLKIKPSKPLPFVTLGNSDDSRVGDWVLAIGNPLGFGGTVTAGIISARSRYIGGSYDDFIQTDAAINKGNSGGPLFNIKGEVIGINAAIYSQTGGSIGIGFSIPSNLAKPILADLQKFGRAHRGWLGVHIQTVDDEIAENMGLKDQHGALVADVMAKGPAEKAGIKVGDVIVKFDGKDVPDMHHLPRMVAETAIGKEVAVSVMRDGKKLDLKITLGELPDEVVKKSEKTKEKSKDKKDNNQTSLSSIGLSVSSITQALREKYDISPEAKGVVITEVNPNGSAAERGIHVGDVIVEASQELIKSMSDLVNQIEAAKKAGRKSILLLIQQNGGGLRFVPVPLNDESKGKK